MRGMLFLQLAKLTKFGGVLDAQLHVHCQTYQRDAEQERHAPPPGHKALRRKSAAHQQEREVGQHYTHWSADLSEASIEPALRSRGAFGHQQHGTCPLPSDGKTLRKTQYDQEQRC